MVCKDIIGYIMYIVYMY